MKQVQPYSALARVYDLVMSHVDYEGWADFLVHLVEMHLPDISGLRALELGGGTGLLTEALYEASDWDLTLTDHSADMLAEAGRRFSEGDVRILNVDFGGAWKLEERDYDVILLMYDGFNYLLEPEGVHALLRGVEAHLKPGGLFLFDQSTPHNSINNAEFFEDEGEEDGLEYRRTSHFDEESAIHTTSFDIVTPAGRFHEEHRQRAWTRSAVEGLLRQHPLEILASFDGFSLDPSDDESERVHWVLRKPD